MSLRETLEATAAKSASKIPPDALEIMHRATEGLRASDIMDGVLQAGDGAPAFELPNTENKLVSLGDLIGDRWLVLSFYRGVW